MDTFRKTRVRAGLVKLYGEEKAEELICRFEHLLDNHLERAADFVKSSGIESEQTVILITYADMLRSNDEKPLVTLNAFLNRYCGSIIDTVHLLPFFPYSSDDGFSVIDYYAVDQNHGTWDDIGVIAQDFKLMFDFVANHMSAGSEWFSNYLKGVPGYKTFFVDIDGDPDLSDVTRPRSLPVLTKFEAADGVKKVWTTFSEDQVDLNYADPEVLLTMTEVILEYVARGASLLRLDAIAFLWKQIGTNCIHLDNTHLVIKLWREILNEVAPQVALVSETNVPHQENISYFGADGDEAQMVYQFSLAPLIAHSILKSDSTVLTSWAQSLEPLSDGTAFFNFTASHDGIGMRPLKGLVSDDEIEFLCLHAVKRGGNISYKTNPDGSESPYELNVSYYNMLQEVGDSESVTIDKFLLSQAIMVAMPGVPGIYFHSLVGSWNYRRGVDETGRYRTINREKLEYDELIWQLNSRGMRRHKIFYRYTHLLEVRRTQSAFSPKAAFEFLSSRPELFVFVRFNEETKQRIVVVNNLGDRAVELSRETLPQLFTKSIVRDLLSGYYYFPQSDEPVSIGAYSTMWFDLTES